MSDHSPLLEMDALTRKFPGVTALDGVNIVIARGEIVGLMGANGAGKSTLLQVLGGVLTPHAGHLRWHGREVALGTPRSAAALGISLVPQEPALPENLTVAEAFSLGREPVRGRVFIDRAAADRRARESLEQLGVAVDPAAPMACLSVAQRQLVAIARALASSPELLLLDEPTGPLRPQETDRFFEALGDLQARGTAIIYASDRLGEIEALATRVLVLRDGKLSGCLDRELVNREAIHRLSAGAALDLPIKELIEPGIARLCAVDVRTARFPSCPVSLSVREGEIVGLAGLVGSGRTRLLRALCGLDQTVGGTVVINGAPLTAGRPDGATGAGAAFLAADRPLEDAPPGLTLRDAITLTGIRRLAPVGLVAPKIVHRLAALLNAHLAITDGPLDQPVCQLSPGQRQKILLAQVLALQPTVVLLDEPTRGVDVATRAEIYESLERLAERGAAVLFASNEIDELLRVADRLLVLRDGALAGTLTRDDDFTERGVMRLAAGL